MTNAPGVERLLAIIEIQNQIAASRFDVATVMRVVTDRAWPLVKASAALVDLVDGEDMVCRAVSGALSASIGTRLPRAGSLSGLCVEQATPLRCDDIETDSRVNREACRKAGVRSMICVPLVPEGQPVGVLTVTSETAAAFGDDDVETLKLLAQIVATAIQQADDLTEAVRDSLHDTITGLPNRRLFDTRLLGEVARHKRYKLPLSLAVLDLDGFKAANETLGRPAGDGILRQVAERLTATLRETDAAFRFGGDEFAIILPSTTLPQAELAAARLRTAVDEARLGGGLITLSAGVAELVSGDGIDLLRRADIALYAEKRRKKSGRL